MIESSRPKLLWLLCVVALVAIAAVSLVPTQWELRTGLHWLVEHFIVYFAVTAVICIIWPRPFLVGALLMIFAGALEALQGLTIDRTPDLLTGLSGGAGVLSASVAVWFLIRRWKIAKFWSYGARYIGKSDFCGDVSSGIDREGRVGVAPLTSFASHRLRPH
jgi:hypothetical protein